ncbi:unnamed protein product [Clavelina lepadiformis]|uniref:Uncharacterized protein n=1 Tax=Clavelina lepadiformis TaxID=159417 RepID=A0ABP0GZJ3_CLALP
MNCVFKTNAFSGYINVKHLDYSSVGYSGIVMPSTWIKYIELSRSWILSCLLQVSSEKLIFEMKNMEIEYFPESFKLNISTRDLSEITSSHWNNSQVLNLLQIPFQISYALVGVKDSVLIGKVEITNILNKQIVMVANLEDSLQPYALSLDAVYKKLERLTAPALYYGGINVPKHHQLSDPPSNCKLFCTSYQISYLHVDRSGNLNLGSLIDMCYNCAEEGFRSGFNMHFIGSVFKHATKCVQVNIMQRFCAVKIVKISMWIDVACSRTLHFTVENGCSPVCSVMITLCEFSKTGIAKL